MTQLYKPRPYQRIATAFVRDNPRCALYLDMGLGKSCSVLTALEDLHFLGEITGPVLVLAPLRVARTTWPEEVAKWSHLKNIVCIPILGSSAQRDEILRRYLPRANRRETRLQVFTINYDNVPWLVDKLGDKWPFRVIVSDESTRLKNYRGRLGGLRSGKLAKVAWGYVDRFIQLTGTPSPNGLQDLWGQIWFLDRGKRLGLSYTAFIQRWFQKGFDGYSLKPLPGTSKEIESRLKDIVLTLRAEDYFPVEDPIVRCVYVDLPPEVRKQYRKLEREMYLRLEVEMKGHTLHAPNAAALTMKCLQLASGAVIPTESEEKWVPVHDEKIQALKSIVAEANGKPILVAYHFRSDLERLLKAFPEGRHLDKNPKTITEWNAGNIPVLFAHPASAGHGLNLQHGGNILVFFSHWWDLEQFQQIIERIGPVRQKQAGFNRPVFIYHIIARGTVDETVMARRESKRDVQELLLDAMKQQEVT